MRTLIIYDQRLGDIIRCLPIARHFAAQGHEVFFRCKQQYEGIFDAVAYAWRETSAKRTQEYAQTFDLQIWPHRYDEFRHSGQTWMDYVYSLYPAIWSIDRSIVFDALDLTPDPHERYALPQGYKLAALFGYSQTRQLNFLHLLKAASNALGDEFYFLADPLFARWLMEHTNCPRRRIVIAESVGHLPRIIRDAADLFTINSAPTVIASAVRTRWHHVIDANPQDDFYHANQIRVAI